MAKALITHYLLLITPPNQSEAGWVQDLSITYYLPSQAHFKLGARSDIYPLLIPSDYNDD